MNRQDATLAALREAAETVSDVARHRKAGSAEPGDDLALEDAAFTLAHRFAELDYSLSHGQEFPATWLLFRPTAEDARNLAATVRATTELASDLLATHTGSPEVILMGLVNELLTLTKDVPR